MHSSIHSFIHPSSLPCMVPFVSLNGSTREGRPEHIQTQHHPSAPSTTPHRHGLYRPPPCPTTSPPPQKATWYIPLPVSLGNAISLAAFTAARKFPPSFALRCASLTGHPSIRPRLIAFPSVPEWCSISSRTRPVAHDVALAPAAGAAYSLVSVLVSVSVSVSLPRGSTHVSASVTTASPSLDF